MSLQRKAVIGVMLVSAIVMSGLLVFDRLLIADRFGDLERQEVERDALRAQNFVDMEAEALDLLLWDWASWDDMYGFMQTRAPEFLESNLTSDILEGIALAALILLDEQGQPVASRTRWPSGDEAPIPGLRAGEEVLRRIVDQVTTEGELLGIVTLPVNTPLLVASRHILTSEDEGPAAGMLLMARWLDDAFAERMSMALATPLRFERVHQVNWELDDLLDSENGVLAVWEGSELNGHALLLNLDGEPVLLIETSQRREISALRSETFVITVAGMVVMALVLSGLIFFGIRVGLLRGMLRLREEMESVTARGARVTVGADDEVGEVARAVNEMLDRLQETSAEQRRLATLASEQEEVARTALLEMSEGFLSFNEDGRCVLCNPTAGRMLGIDPGDAPGKHISDLLPPIQREQGAASGPQLIVVRGRSLAVTRTAGSDRGRRRSVVVLRDVSDVLDIERLRRDIVSTVSHELRTPLTAIRATVDLFQSGDGGELSEVQQRMIGLMSRNSDRLMQIVNDLLVLSSLEGRNVSIHRDDVDLLLLARRVVDDLSPSAVAASVTLRVEGTNSAVAWGDEQRLRQVLENLVQNAIKFSPDGGDVSVEVTSTEREVTVQVRDSGMGIPAGERQRVFEKFYRTQQGQRVTGSGLGLAIARLIVDLHGGRIHLEGNTPQGTVVTFTVPRPPAG